MENEELSRRGQASIACKARSSCGRMYSRRTLDRLQWLPALLGEEPILFLEDEPHRRSIVMWQYMDKAQLMLEGHR